MAWVETLSLSAVTMMLSARGPPDNPDPEYFMTGSNFETAASGDCPRLSVQSPPWKMQGAV
jgi:hypothetical protein